MIRGSSSIASTSLHMQIVPPVLLSRHLSSSPATCRSQGPELPRPNRPPGGTGMEVNSVSGVRETVCGAAHQFHTPGSCWEVSHLPACSTPVQCLQLVPLSECESGGAGTGGSHPPHPPQPPPPPSYQGIVVLIHLLEALFGSDFFS